MRQKAVLLPLALAAGLALAGCSGDPQPAADTSSASPTPSATPSATSSATPADEPTRIPSAAPAPTAEAAPAPAPEQPQPQPEQAAPADPLAAFTATPEGGRYAGALAGVEQQPGQGGVVHRLVADTNDRAVAVEICRAYQSSMGTGQAQIDVVDTAGQLLAATAGDPKSCQVTAPPDVGAVPFPAKFSYEEALAAWQNGMPYYDAFCLNYDPVTEAGLAQCAGIENGTVDSVTGEYIGG